MELTVGPVVEALLAMRPQTQEIVLVHGTSDFDRSWRDNALRQCAPFADRVKVTDFPELPLEELKSRLGELSEETAVLYFTYFQSPTGETYTPARVAKEIAAVLAVQAALIAGLLAQRAWRRRSEREALELCQELTHASRVTMLGTLAASLAHELNQPLGAILRNAEAAELFL